MQQAPQAAPSAGFNLLLGAVLGVFGLISVVDGVTGEGFGVLLKGLAITVYAALLLRDGLHIRKTGQPAMTRRRMNTIGLVCLVVYFIGVMIRRGPELASFFG